VSSPVSVHAIVAHGCDSDTVVAGRRLGRQLPDQTASRVRTIVVTVRLIWRNYRVRRSVARPRMRWFSAECVTNLVRCSDAATRLSIINRISCRQTPRSRCVLFLLSLKKAIAYFAVRRKIVSTVRVEISTNCRHSTSNIGSSLFVYNCIVAVIVTRDSRCLTRVFSAAWHLLRQCRPTRPWSI